MRSLSAGEPRAKREGNTAATPHQRHTVYVMWHFPLLSETFIQREILALKKRGLKISVVADAIADTRLLNDDARRLVKNTVTVLPMTSTKSKEFLRHFLATRPQALREALSFITRHRYHERSDKEFDRRIFRKTSYIAGLCRELGATHIHSPWADLNAVTGLWAARMLGLPFSVQARAHDIHRRNYLYGLREKLSGADLVITNTDYNVGHIKKLTCNHPPRQLVRIYNGIPLDRFHHKTPDRLKTGPVRILTVARLIEQKGIDDLLQACLHLTGMGIDFRAVVVGGAEEDYEHYAGRLKTERTKLGLSDRVEFIGEKSHDDVMDLYGKADMFVLPCKIASDGSRDIIPNVLIEAMAAGLPCISTRITGITEIIEHRVSGLLVEPSDSVGLANAIRELSTDYDLRCELSDGGRKMVEARFDIRKNISRYIAAFRSLDS